MKVYREILSDLKAMDRNPKVMRNFGLVSAVILLAIAGLLLYRFDPAAGQTRTVPIILLSVAFLTVIMALVKPLMLKPINTVLVIISLVIGNIMTRLVLVLLFFCLFFPVSIVLKVFGKDSMRLKLEPSSPSYWIIRPDEPFDPARCRRLF